MPSPMAISFTVWMKWRKSERHSLPELTQEEMKPCVVLWPVVIGELDFGKRTLLTKTIPDPYHVIGGSYEKFKEEIVPNLSQMLPEHREERHASQLFCIKLTVPL